MVQQATLPSTEVDLGEDVSLLYSSLTSGWLLVQQATLPSTEVDLGEDVRIWLFVQQATATLPSTEVDLGIWMRVYCTLH